MKILISFIKIVLNIFFFIVYSLFSIVLVNFVYGLVLTKMWISIPDSTDSVHLKMAVLVVLVILFLTILFRKYFYLNVCFKKDIKENKISKIENDKTVIKESPKVEIEEEIEIYINKEIK